MNCGIPKFSVYCVDQELLQQLMSGVRKFSKYIEEMDKCGGFISIKWFLKLFIFPSRKYS